MSEIVTEGRYTRAYVFCMGTITMGYILAFTGWAFSFWAGNFGQLAASVVLVVVGLYFIYTSLSALHRGFCYRLKSRFENPPGFTLDDVDGSELVDGPVEVEA